MYSTVVFYLGKPSVIIYFVIEDAILAQLVEQLTRNEQVAGSIPADGSTIMCGYRIAAIM